MQHKSSLLLFCLRPTIAWTLVLIYSNVPCSGQETVDNDWFESNIRPMLVDKCYSCHSPAADEIAGDLRLDIATGIRKGGAHGPAIVIGVAEQSLLVRAVEYADSAMQMPPDGKLSEEEIAKFRKWITLGAPDPRTDDAAPKVKTKAELLSEKSKAHWAYQPLAEPPSLDGQSASSVLVDPIDRSIEYRLAAQKLSMSDSADRRTLVKRLYYDLLGIPATLNELNRWEQNKDPLWYEQLVDSLLESPHFGERMARRWMDVARYADNKGYVFQEDREYPHAYKYRDWLIRSFNQDLPYNEFVQYQLIGDRLDPENKAGHLDAMGMLTLGRRFLQNKNDIVDDRIDVVSRGLLGVTASCARCHDHKFDPVSMSDYYSMFAAFMGSEEPGGEPSAMRLIDKAEQGPTRIFLRGSPGNQGPDIPRRFIAFLNDREPREMTTGSGRTEMARGIVSPDNPLTARVYVNRLWGWIYGSPLVDTPSDFGLRCEPPVQRDVLDRIAWEFVQQGWSTKKIIRRIVLMRTYQQSSVHRDDAFAIDPENRLLWRANRKRMDFESFRDAMLSATGQIDKAIGGPSVRIDQPPFAKRRTLYAYIDRQNLPQFFRSFDFASPDAHVPQRSQTTVPQQGLVLLNSDMVLDMINWIAQQASERGTDAGIEFVFQEILSRKPNATEIEWVRELLKANDIAIPDEPHNAWSYGVVTVDAEGTKVSGFQRLPIFSDNKWHGFHATAEAPESLAQLHAKGGHPGEGLQQSVVRRWTALHDGTFRIRGHLKHSKDEGDGVRASVIVRESEPVGQWIARNSETDTVADSIDLRVGDTVDFVVDYVAGLNHDSFEWTVNVTDREQKSRTGSERAFSGSQPVAMTAWEQVVQALLLTNEFCFVD